MTVERKVIWSMESSKKVESIKSYLRNNWSISEVQIFLKRLKRFETIVASFPKLYPVSTRNPELRKAILSKHHSIIYEIDEEIIKVHTILDHRQTRSENE